jgi:3'(2'), 5'-bisphosphate nucleotidase
MLTKIVSLLPQVIDIANYAAREIQRIYEHEDFIISTKSDDSPLTQADSLAHQLIVEGLSALTPDIPILSEEAEVPPYSERQLWSQYWCVDPLDGTKEFIARTGEFTVNIALIVEHEPVLGVIVSPTLQTCYTGVKGEGAFSVDASGHRKPLQTRQWPVGQPLTIAVSRRHRPERLAEQMAKAGEYSVLSMGSSLKFCAIAEQRADLYPRFGQTCEWDTAAGHCILEAAGGAVVDLQGLAIRYNTKEDIFNPGFIATGDLGSLLKRLL